MVVLLCLQRLLHLERLSSTFLARNVENTTSKTDALVSNTAIPNIGAGLVSEMARNSA